MLSKYIANDECIGEMDDKVSINNGKMEITKVYHKRHREILTHF